MTHDDETVNVVRSQFDGVLEIRETNAGRETRLRGLGGAREWVSL